MQLRRARSRYFTPAEASDLLGRIAPMVAETAALARAREAALARLHANEQMTPPERQALARHAEDLRHRVHMGLDELGDLGVEVRTLAPTRVDFPALRDGVEVWLCWTDGESEVSWWHPRHTGAGDRKPVKPGTPGRWEWCQ